jgi:hypothetical protein
MLTWDERAPARQIELKQGPTSHVRGPVGPTPLSGQLVTSRSDQEKRHRWG